MRIAMPHLTKLSAYIFLTKQFVHTRSVECHPFMDKCRNVGIPLAVAPTGEIYFSNRVFFAQIYFPFCFAVFCRFIFSYYETQKEGLAFMDSFNIKLVCQSNMLGAYVRVCCVGLCSIDPGTRITREQNKQTEP